LNSITTKSLSSLALKLSINQKFRKQT